MAGGTRCAGGGGVCAPSEGVEERGTDITQEFCSPAAEEGRTRGDQGWGLWVTDICTMYCTCVY
jgi:hypothetical protein